MTTPEAPARQQIDTRLAASGWLAQDYRRLDPAADRAGLPFLYESTGIENLFRDARNPEPKSRRVFAFHRPETLADHRHSIVEELEIQVRTNLFRAGHLRQSTLQNAFMCN